MFWKYKKRMGEKGFSPRNRRTERDNYVRSGEEVTIEGDNEGEKCYVEYKQSVHG